jgi:hypothetical protein
MPGLEGNLLDGLEFDGIELRDDVPSIGSESPKKVAKEYTPRTKKGDLF